MRLEHVDRTPSTEALFTPLKTSPLVVWVSRFDQLLIEPGDSISSIVLTVRRFFRQLSIPQLQQLVAYWFAIGERGVPASGDAWRERELRCSSRRRYRPTA